MTSIDHECTDVPRVLREGVALASRPDINSTRIRFVDSHRQMRLVDHCNVSYPVLKANDPFEIACVDIPCSQGHSSVAQSYEQLAIVAHSQ